VFKQFKLVDLQQRTFGPYGHFLNHRQAQTCDGKHLVYDTRNADPDIPKTRRIEAIDLADNTVKVLYDTQSDQPFGPGVGAVVADPHHPRVLFIHGLKNCSSQNPYAIGRRFGALCSLNQNSATNSDGWPLESRCMAEAVPWGCLRGGSHAHSFSPDGRWISFTYNDAWVARHNPSSDRRTIGFALLPQEVTITTQQEVHKDNSSHVFGKIGEITNPTLITSRDRPADAENFQGIAWAALALDPIEPTSEGQSKVEQQTNKNGQKAAHCEWAREECWVPNPLRLAFVGRISQTAWRPSIEEVFIAEFPKDASHWPKQLQGYVPTDPTTGRLQAPPGIQIRRLTYSDSDLVDGNSKSAIGFCPELATKDLSHRGIQGPRHWLLASPCGDWIFGLFKDITDCVRLVRICSRTGALRPISKPGFSITHPPALDPSGRMASLVSGQSLHLLDLITEKQIPVEGWIEQTNYGVACFEEVIGPVQFLKDGSGFFWNARPSETSWLQIWTGRVQ